jgi:hypothetical protein
MARTGGKPGRKAKKRKKARGKIQKARARETGQDVAGISPNRKARDAANQQENRHSGPAQLGVN